MTKLTKEYKQDVFLFGDQIKKDYQNNLSPIEISKNLKIKVSRIYKYLKEIDILKSKRESQTKLIHNINYFEKIDNKRKAYFLGLLYADGCNTRTGFAISLVEQDKYILELLKKDMKFSGNLNFLIKRSETQNNQFRLSLTGQKISKDLEKLGLFPKKSLILEFPTKEQVPENFIHHFIRGYFDGDGSVWKGKLSIGLTITSTKNFNERVLEVLKCLKIRIPPIYILKNKKTSNICWGSKKDIKIIYEWLYKDCEDLYLKRKKEKFEQIIK